MNYFDEFKDLLPDKLETIKNIIDIITQEVVNLRITNLKYQVKNKNPLLFYIHKILLIFIDYHISRLILEPANQLLLFKFNNLIYIVIY